MHRLLNGVARDLNNADVGDGGVDNLAVTAMSSLEARLGGNPQVNLEVFALQIFHNLFNLQGSGGHSRQIDVFAG